MNPLALATLVAIISAAVAFCLWGAWTIGYDRGFEDGALAYMRELKIVRDEYAQRDAARRSNSELHL